MTPVTIYLRNPAGAPEPLPPICMSPEELGRLSDHWMKCFGKMHDPPGGGAYKCKTLGKGEERTIILNFADIVAIV